MSKSELAEPERLAERVEALERELEELRRQLKRALDAVSSSISARSVERVIDDVADRRLTEAEMEEAFARLDTVLDASR